jgi:S-adenosylmethionine synthetase
MAGMRGTYVFTSESVCEGHPDKVCDFVADSLLDAHLAQDLRAHVACEVLAKGPRLVLAGEITSTAEVDAEAEARAALREIGYTDPGEPFNAEGVQVLDFLSAQAVEIDQAVRKTGKGATTAAGPKEQGAGDQGMMFGYATDETPELMPLPILLAHRLSSGLAAARKAREVPWLRPDGKTQVSVEYEDGTPLRVAHVLVSTQHHAGIGQDAIRAWVAGHLVPRALGEWAPRPDAVTVNPSGSFVEGGPSADCGVTGRKIIVDTYGGMARHGGGAFSGKDPSKVDRSGAYFCRFVARQVVKRGIARRAEVQVAYAIGVAQPMSVLVQTFGTGEQRAAEEFVRTFDFRPAAIIERLGLLRPIYRRTTNYGHFGRAGLPWEE